MVEPLFVADSIGKSFGRNQVLTAATLWAYPGEVTVLLGRNGTGKSTLMKIATGQLRADWGSVRFGGRALPRPRLHRLAQAGLMYVPQEGLFVRDWRLRDQLEILTNEDDRGIRDWSERWEVQDFLDVEPRSLSGGERNRISMAAAVLKAPTCLLADEPLTGAAPMDRERVGSMIGELAGNGCAVVVTGHEVTELMALADRVIWITAGATRDMGPPEVASQDVQFRREYLGPRDVSPA